MICFGGLSDFDYWKESCENVNVFDRLGYIYYSKPLCLLDIHVSYILFACSRYTNVAWDFARFVYYFKHCYYCISTRELLDRTREVTKKESDSSLET